MHKFAAGCKKVLKARKEYTDNHIKKMMSIDIYQGKERATGKFKTTVKWSNGEVVTLRADKNTLPIYYIFAYAYCERKYGSNSAFKKYVDRHCVRMDKELIFEDDGLMTSMQCLTSHCKVIAPITRPIMVILFSSQKGVYYGKR